MQTLRAARCATRSPFFCGWVCGCCFDYGCLFCLLPRHAFGPVTAAIGAAVGACRRASISSHMKAFARRRRRQLRQSTERAAAAATAKVAKTEARAKGWPSARPSLFTPAEPDPSVVASLRRPGEQERSQWRSTSAAPRPRPLQSEAPMPVGVFPN